jgi:hypothetical protein
VAALLDAVNRSARIKGRNMNQPRTNRHSARSGWSWWYLLFVIQFVASLWVSSYNRIDPTWIGIPFFYWYQMLWVIIGAILTAVVYFATDE